MNHDRVKMLEALNLVKPALASKDLIEELCHVWFDGKTVTAYNDADLGIQAPFESPFKGGIRGALLLGLLHNSRAKEVVFEHQEEGKVLLKAARAKVNLAVLDPERAVYELPKPSDTTYEFDEHFITAMKLVMVSVGNDTSIPEKMGVTLLVADGYIYLHTTDSKTIASAEVPIEKKNLKALKAGSRYILPTAFCEQMIRLCPAGGVLDLQRDIVTAENADGIFIWARLAEQGERSFDFDGAYSKYLKFPKGTEFELPSRLALALERTLTMLDGLPDEPADVTVDAGKLRLEVEIEGRGNYKDSVDIPESVPDVKIKVNPALIKRAFSQSDHIAITDRVVYMRGPNGFEYLAQGVG